MSETSSTVLLNELIMQCTNEFFQSRGVSLHEGAARDGVIEHAAAIGFSSREMRGVVGIGMETATLRRIVAMQPLLGAHVSVEDWLGEAANQLLGRFKNKLVSYGPVVSIALPMVLRGMRMQFVPIGAEGLWTHVAQSGAGQVWVWLDVRMSDDVVLERSTDPDVQSAPEGAMVLF